jgi:hypothetical protein
LAASTRRWAPSPIVGRSKQARSPRESLGREPGVVVAGQVSSAPLAPCQEPLQVSSAECGRPAKHPSLSQEVGKRSFSADVAAVLRDPIISYRLLRFAHIERS